METCVVNINIPILGLQLWLKQLKALVLAEDWGLIPNIYVVPYNHL